jgi:hypothetical protein
LTIGELAEMHRTCQASRIEISDANSVARKKQANLLDNFDSIGKMANREENKNEHLSPQQNQFD